jgi:hypothetical protein
LVIKPNFPEFTPRSHLIANEEIWKHSLSVLLQFHMGHVEEIAKKGSNTVIRPRLALLRNSIALIDQPGGSYLVNFHFFYVLEQVGEDEDLKRAMRLLGVCLQVMYTQGTIKA